MDQRYEMLQECDEIILQLKRELHAVVDAKWNRERKTFREKKALVITLLRTLIKDVKAITYRSS